MNQLSGKLFLDSLDDDELLLLRSQVPKYEALDSLPPRNHDEPEPEPCAELWLEVEHWLERELRSARLLRSLARDQVPVG